MDSDSEEAPKARFRFGFSGKRKRIDSTSTTQMSSDDILDGLTKHAASQLEFQEQHTRSLEVLADEDDTTLSAKHVLSAETAFGSVTRKKLRHFMIVAMGGAGLIVVWLYSSAKGMIGTAFLDSLLQRTGIHSVFGNPVQVGIVSIVALMTSVWISVRRRRARLDFQIETR